MNDLDLIRLLCEPGLSTDDVKQLAASRSEPQTAGGGQPARAVDSGRTSGGRMRGPLVSGGPQARD